MDAFPPTSEFIALDLSGREGVQEFVCWVSDPDGWERLAEGV